MSVPELQTAIRAVKERTDTPLGVNIRSDGLDVGDRIDLMIREGVKVGSFALAPKKELIARLRDVGVVTMPSIGAKRRPKGRRCVRTPSARSVPSPRHGTDWCPFLPTDCA